MLTLIRNRFYLIDVGEFARLGILTGSRFWPGWPDEANDKNH
jgi:hypothetical protein